MSILDLLKAAKGEHSTESRIGRWRKAVSQAIDTGTAVSTPADYINSKNSGAQVGVAQDNNIVVDQEINVRGITRPSTTAFQLTPGKTYHLLAHARFNAFSDPVQGVLALRWVDDNDANIPTTGPDAIASRHLPATNTDNLSEDPVVDVIYTCPNTVAGSQVKLRCTSATGTATLPSNGVSVTIVEIK